MQIEDINNKSNPNNQSNESHGEQKLTFMMDEVWLNQFEINFLLMILFL